MLYAELHAFSSFSFLKGASHPDEMVKRAAELGYSAVALTDECSVAGVVRAHVAAQEMQFHFIVGASFRCDDGLEIVVLAQTRRGYGALCRLITRARRAAGKGAYRLRCEDLQDALPECSLIWLPAIPRPSRDGACVTPATLEQGAWLKEQFDGRLWVGAELHRHGDDAARLKAFNLLGTQLRLPITACGGALMHVRDRKPLQDAMTAIRLNKPVAECGYELESNAEKHLRDLKTLAALYPRVWLEESVAIAKQCVFSLSQLRYEYPRELVPEGETPSSHLRKLTYKGAQSRWPQGLSGKIKNLIETELRLIGELKYESFFLTVQELVEKSRQLGILCQGRGSAANSAVCYCLGVTAVDPDHQEVLFERFISKNRNEPPDIDVDFEHERRDEIIQHIYEKYGRHRTGIAATVVTYGLRSALRDAGKALGLDALQIERLGQAFNRRSSKATRADTRRWLREAGFDPQSPVIENLLELTRQLMGFPRHLSQHVGGFVISADSLEELVPIENARMTGRTVIQWEKNDLESLGLLKVDVLALGMLTAIRRALSYYNAAHGKRLELYTIPQDDKDVYRMIQSADTVGVFQIESRAQMSMLPRLKPTLFYHLVIEIAIVRPGPIQGGMVHPYLRRKAGLEEVTYPSEQVKKILERTLGVPIFQEQVMQLAIEAAGFSPSEADNLRRAMATWKNTGKLEAFRERLVAGMLERHYSLDFAERLFKQIEGFGEYGFPESHSASFALLAYASAWLKYHAPAEFTAALLNSQPMGFYQPAQLVRDASEHGVEIRAVDVRASDWDCTLENGAKQQRALRLGMRLVKGLSKSGAERVMAARKHKPFVDSRDLALRAQLHSRDLEALAAADALAGLSGNRHQAAWALAGIDLQLPLFKETTLREATPLLSVPTEAQNITADYASVGMTLRRHPLALLRDRLLRRHILSAVQLRDAEHELPVCAAGLVLARQSPGSAKNTTFVTLEDETGIINLIVREKIARRYRQAFLQAQLLEVRGKLQHQSGVMHVVAEELIDRTHWLGSLRISARNFH